MKRNFGKKHFSEKTGKLHIRCPHADKSGVGIHVVIKEGACYRSGDCMVVECKYNAMQSDVEHILSVTW